MGMWVSEWEVHVCGAQAFRVSHCTWSSLTQLGWLASQLQGSPCLHLPRARITDVPVCPAFYLGAGGLNSGPHACMTSTLPLAPAPAQRLPKRIENIPLAVSRGCYSLLVASNPFLLLSKHLHICLQSACVGWRTWKDRRDIDSNQITFAVTLNYPLKRPILTVSCLHRGMK